jgi:hypothetical protein
MRTATRWLAFVGMIFVLLGVPALATPNRGGASATPKAHGPKTTTVKASSTVAPVKSSTTKVKGSAAAPKTTTSKGATTKLAKSTTPKGNSAAAKTKGSATTTTSTTSGTTTTASTTTSGSGTTSSGGTGSTTTAGTWTPDNPVAQKLSTKSNIMKKAQNVIGMDVDLNNATSGFKNFGQFVAAVNVSNNHQIAFADLKAAMTGIDIDGKPVITTTPTGGTTTTSTLSLGQAIQKLKTGVDSETVAQSALTQANAEITSSPTTTTTSTSTTKSKSK